jgi:hypothetical protein
MQKLAVEIKIPPAIEKTQATRMLAVMHQRQQGDLMLRLFHTSTLDSNGLSKCLFATCGCGTGFSI